MHREEHKPGDMRFVYQYVKNAQFNDKHKLLFVDTIVGGGAIISPATAEDEKKYPFGTTILIVQVWTANFGGGWANVGIAKKASLRWEFTDILIEEDLKKYWRLPNDDEEIINQCVTLCLPNT